MKVVIDSELCQASGTCVQVAPFAFDLEADGWNARVLLGDVDAVDADQRERVNRAVASCPTAAITVVAD